MEEPGGLQSWGRKACRHGHNIPINSRPSIHKFSFQAFSHSPPPLGTQTTTTQPPTTIREPLVTILLVKPAFAQGLFY